MRREAYRQLGLVILHSYAAVLAAIALGIHVGAVKQHAKDFDIEKKD